MIQISRFSGNLDAKLRNVLTKLFGSAYPAAEQISGLGLKHNITYYVLCVNYVIKDNLTAMWKWEKIILNENELDKEMRTNHVLI